MAVFILEEVNSGRTFLALLVSVGSAGCGSPGGMVEWSCADLAALPPGPTVEPAALFLESDATMLARLASAMGDRFDGTVSPTPGGVAGKTHNGADVKVWRTTGLALEYTLDGQALAHSAAGAEDLIRKVVDRLDLSDIGRVDYDSSSTVVFAERNEANAYQLVGGERVFVDPPYSHSAASVVSDEASSAPTIAARTIVTIQQWHILPVQSLISSGSVTPMARGWHNCQQPRPLVGDVTVGAATLAVVQEHLAYYMNLSAGPPCYGLEHQFHVKASIDAYTGSLVEMGSKSDYCD